MLGSSWGEICAGAIWGPWWEPRGRVEAAEERPQPGKTWEPSKWESGAGRVVLSLKRARQRSALSGGQVAGFPSWDTTVLATRRSSFTGRMVGRSLMTGNEATRWETKPVRALEGKWRHRATRWSRMAGSGPRGLGIRTERVSGPKEVQDFRCDPRGGGGESVEVGAEEGCVGRALALGFQLRGACVLPGILKVLFWALNWNNEVCSDVYLKYECCLCIGLSDRPV